MEFTYLAKTFIRWVSTCTDSFGWESCPSLLTNPPVNSSHIDVSKFLNSRAPTHDRTPSGYTAWGVIFDLHFAIWKLNWFYLWWTWQLKTNKQALQLLISMVQRKRNIPKSTYTQNNKYMMLDKSRKSMFSLWASLCHLLRKSCQSLRVCIF